MAGTARRAVFPAPGAYAEIQPVQIKNSSMRLRPALLASGRCLYCPNKFRSTSSAVGNLGERPSEKWICSTLNPVKPKDVRLEGGETVSQALEQLRLLVEQKGGDVKSADDMEMLRFLRARSNDMEKAATAFVSHQMWRAEFVPNGRFIEADLPTELDAKKSYLIPQDKKGRPVILSIGRNHVYNKQDFTEFTRFLVYALDKVIAGSPPGSEDFLAIVDLKGIGVKSLDSKSFIAAFDLLQNHYPGRVDKIFMINVPLIFNGLWKVVSKFLDEGTKKKIIFVGNKKLIDTLLEEIDVDYLPKEYGGNGDLILLQDAKICDIHLA